MTFDFSKVTRSVRIPGVRPARGFPHREDYLRFCIERGYLQSGAPLSRNRELVLALHSHWHSLGQQGCVFAQLLSTRPADYGWARKIIPGTCEVQNSLAWDFAKEAIEHSIEHEHTGALSLLFPDVDGSTIAPLDSLIKAVQQYFGWRVTLGKVVKQYVPIQLIAPLRNGAVSSWVLGLGPYAHFPLTRQSPVLELVFATKQKAPQGFKDRRLNSDPSLAHVADLRAPVASEQTMLLLLDKTVQRKQAILGADDRGLARARVTFIVPERHQDES